MTAAVPCPLCGSRATSTWGRASLRDLERGYQRAYAVRIDPLTASHDELRLLECPGCDMKFFDPAIVGDVRFYERLESFDWYYAKSKSEFDLAAKFIEPADDVLEIGCGAGHFGRAIRCRSYVGLELTGLAAQAARDAGLDVLQESIAEHAARRRASYSAVCAFQVLEHIAGPGAFLREALKCLKPSGKLIVSVPSADGYVARAPNNWLNLPPHHVTWWSDAALRNIAREFDLTVTCLEHEALADEHVDAFVHTMLTAKLSPRWAQRLLVDFSLRARLTDRLVSLAVPLARRRLLANGPRPRGHSVTAVYQRKSA